MWTDLNVVDHVSIEGTQRRTATQHRHLALLHARQEARALQRHVACTDDARLAGGGLLHEQIIRSDCQLTAGDVQLRRTPTRGDHKARTSDGLRLALGVGELHGIGADELAELVEVGDTGLA